MSTQGTYVAKPFITRDGKDEQGVRAEVRVLTGYGDIVETKSSSGGKMTNIVFDGEKFKYKQSGWAQNDTPLFAKIEEAQKNNEPIHFRIEYRRKEGIDRTIPFSQLGTDGNMSKAKDTYFKSIAGVRLDGDDEWTWSPNKVTNPKEDPSAGGIIPASDDDIEPVKSPWNSDDNAPKYDNLVEPPRWVTRKKSGEVNLGSAAAAVLVNTYGFVLDLKTEKGLEFMDDKKAKALARLLVRAAGRIQVAGYEGREDALGAADLSLESHTRARGIVFNLVRNAHTPTDETFTDKAAFKAYGETLAEEGAEIWQWSIAETTKLLG